MYQVMLIRPGSTDYDEQGRIKGRLDIPLNQKGIEQIGLTVDGLRAELSNHRVTAIYSAPCQAAIQTAEILGQAFGVKAKKMTGLTNLDPGLWQGKLIDEVRQQHPKIYRRWQEQPETVCPPEGEMIGDARRRLGEFLQRITKKSQGGVAIMVAPEPLASVLKGLLKQQQLGDLWEAESKCGHWELIRVENGKQVSV